MNVEEVLSKNGFSFTKDKSGNFWLEVKNEEITRTLTELKRLGLNFLSCISGLDCLDKGFCLVYHLSSLEDYSTVVNVRTYISRENPEISSVSSVFKVAELYEREVFDLLGIKFVGHPNLKRLLLPEDVPEDYHPLRKA
ncbi:MAG: NADH-quinone oxidoreductase subunit C [Thaumarchaeota archaeon]|jgi:NADH-quinone oxidoreductase subunit C|nr:NADH-quinone oxidoreductase subunit C [Nitrososphaerota archaeon]